MEIKKKSPIFIGMGKTLFCSSVSVVDPLSHELVETYLLERYSRKKADGSWPADILSSLKEKYSDRDLVLSENRDVISPYDFEAALDKGFPFFNYLEKKGLHNFSSHFNKQIEYIPHHFAHAQVAKYMSPFKKCAVLVIDGAGSKAADIPRNYLDYEFSSKVESHLHEESSLYLFEQGELTPIMKNWQEFKKSEKFSEHSYSDGLGTCYEKIAEFIFNSKRASGKVMGLAPFGKDLGFETSRELLHSLDWGRSFKGGSKEDWETSGEMDHFKDLACTVQRIFEERMFSIINQIKERLPSIDKLIITGGCALNCTSNMKLIEKSGLEQIYIPPFPGDESIGLGCSLAKYYEGHKWSIKKHSDQHGYLGEKREYAKSDIEKKFESYQIIWPASIAKFSAELISDGHIIGWYQGRSESGPRALGNRSILSRMDIPGRKNYLNESVKFRESFRPYGASVLFERGEEYFHISKDFNNPYMSFAVKLRDKYLDIFKEATHIDQTSRMQLVRREQNPLYYDLIREIETLTGVGAVLNTSLNVMGEPIVETIDDLRNFLDKSNVYGLAIGDAFILKEREV